MTATTIPVIAIDGPTASGKGTVAERVAAKLGFHYLDSGALYRLTAVAALHADVDLADETGVARLAAAQHQGATSVVPLMRPRMRIKANVPITAQAAIAAT